jgi:hypothetical protein
MTDGTASDPAPNPAPTPPSPRPLMRTLAIDVALPWFAVQVLQRLGHVPIVPALALAALFPAASIILSWVRRRRVDVIGLAVFVTIAGGIAVALLVNDPRFAVLKGAPGFGLFGLACLLSLCRNRPLMFFVAREFNSAGDKAKAAAWNARLARPGFRQAMRRLTLIWGIACLGEAALGIAAALWLVPATALVVEPILGIGTISALLAWTFRFARRREAAARDTALVSDAERVGAGG